MGHGEITVLFDEDAPSMEVVLPRYCMISGIRAPACLKPGTFLNGTISYKKLYESFTFFEKKFQAKYDPNYVEEEPRSRVYGVGRQARRHRQLNRQRARSASFTRVRLDHLVIYHVLSWIESKNKTCEEAVKHVCNLPLVASTIQNWRVNGAAHYRREIELHGNRRSKHEGSKPIFHQEVDIALELQDEWIKNKNNSIRQKFELEHHRKMTQSEELALFHKNKFKTSRTWYNSFLERQKLLNLSLSSTKKMTAHEWMHRMVQWLPNERFYYSTSHPWVLNVEGYVDRNQFFNVDEVPIQFVKKEGKQATTIENQDVRQSTHKAATGDPSKRIGTLVLTVPMAPISGPYINPLIDCKPFLIMKGLC